MEWLLTNIYGDEAVSVQFGVDPYLVCSENSASLWRQSVPDTFVDLGLVNDPGLKKFFDSGAVSAALNVLALQDDMLADIVLRAVPSDWRGSDSAPWNPQREHPNVQWFIDLWSFICSSVMLVLPSKLLPSSSALFRQIKGWSALYLPENQLSRFGLRHCRQSRPCGCTNTVSPPRQFRQCPHLLIDQA